MIQNPNLVLFKSICFLIFLLGSLQFLQSQISNDTNNESSVLLINKKLLQDKNRILISDSSNWEFRPKTYDSWFQMNADSNNYIELKPIALEHKYADESGKIKGWFRTRIVVDFSMQNTPLHLAYHNWNPVDLYIDGNLASSFGSTGRFGGQYVENKPIHSSTFDFQLTPNVIHTLDFYFVGRLEDLPSNRFAGGLNFSLLDFETKKYLDIHIQEEPQYNTTRIVVGVLLTILFWFLTFLNPKEKSFVIIALLSTYIFLLSWIVSKYHDPNATFALTKILDYSMIFLVIIFDSVIVFTTALLTGKKVTKAILILLVCLFVFRVLIATGILYQEMGSMVTIFTLLVVIFIGISSYKSMRKSQWSIIFGLLLFIGSVILFAFYFNAYPFDNFKTKSILQTSVFLSFPLSLLIFVSIRFKEIISEVEINAEKLIRIEEEKKQILTNQNERLDKEVKERTAELNLSLQSLKSTQNQLIQTEKMASLGELTAGIAHEIQNPLNFVNNFSEINSELIEDLKDAIASNDQEEINAILVDLGANEEKVRHHGKRADSIVKGMLLHSRQSKGEKVPTDINALCDEFLRLSYHGLRAKDRSFNADFEMDFDESLPNIDVVPQDIGRVLLNLINNAFQACNERSEDTSADRSVSTANENREPREENRDSSDGQISDDQTSDFHSAKNGKRTSSFAEASADKEESGKRNTENPKVIVRTKRLVTPLGGGDSRGAIQISVSDNGPGIPDNIKDKIFQPFFTTKPTGEGTGLGLSLAYDIVKAHGGDIRVESEEGDGTEFIIQLPFV